MEHIERGPGLIERLRSLSARLGCDRTGTTAVEFAIVGVPFLMLCFGVITVGLHFLTTYSLENAVERASRQIRTCQAQSSGMSNDQFKALIKQNGASYIDESKMQVYVQNWGTFAQVQPKACLGNNGQLAGGGLSGNQPIGNSSGGASRIVLVTVCYEWELASRLPFLRLGKMSNGSALIQAATTFKTEPCQ